MPRHKTVRFCPAPHTPAWAFIPLHCKCPWGTRTSVPGRAVQAAAQAVHEGGERGPLRSPKGALSATPPARLRAPGPTTSTTQKESLQPPPRSHVLPEFVEDEAGLVRQLAGRHAAGTGATLSWGRLGARGADPHASPTPGSRGAAATSGHSCNRWLLQGTLPPNRLLQPGALQLLNWGLHPHARDRGAAPCLAAPWREAEPSAPTPQPRSAHPGSPAVTRAALTTDEPVSSKEKISFSLPHVKTRIFLLFVLKLQFRMVGAAELKDDTLNGNSTNISLRKCLEASRGRRREPLQAQLRDLRGHPAELRHDAEPGAPSSALPRLRSGAEPPSHAGGAALGGHGCSPPALHTF